MHCCGEHFFITLRIRNYHKTTAFAPTNVFQQIFAIIQLIVLFNLIQPSFPLVLPVGRVLVPAQEYYSLSQWCRWRAKRRVGEPHHFAEA